MPSIKQLGAALLALALAGTAAAAEIHIGYQKSSLNLIVLKSRGLLEKKLAAQGNTVKWTEFAAGPQLLEALNVGSIDFGMTGDTPPIFAQAGGTQLVYVGYEPPKPQASAILVPADSPIKKLADLKGKKIALQKGSSAHWLLVRALDQNGLKWDDIQPVFLAPADARAAYESKAVDAWAIWDPYYAAAERALKPRVLTTGEGLSANYTFYLASRQFAAQQGKQLQQVFDALSDNDDFLDKQPRETAQILSKAIGLDVPTFETVVSRRPSFRVSWLTPQVAADQQRIADRFAELKLIPKTITVKDIVLPPQ
ncbi:sulfonate transport system substrate-binding protein [Andreprevotia lacus DSM 23236]|jgi:sulfonate transport system substrate-binding protein|uniref:Putative aliphatic sulfonates-binding protein n=1 Tax=Andreprevotia lacus DSM 23236 TaxID=1121001 RepID=A0A1W1X168_9NEIS|nr:sulfonate ABC transporter substrate-binding protein [Andreprevotia lacus]SMC17692.1 sulfonate transport system substrate-binding protein [Andreprevotia lacus DSM 23236]